MSGGYPLHRDLRYRHDERPDPAEWFADRGWTTSPSSVPDELARIGRPYSDHLAEHSLSAPSGLRGP